MFKFITIQNRPAIRQAIGTGRAVGAAACKSGGVRICAQFGNLCKQLFQIAGMIRSRCNVISAGPFVKGGTDDMCPVLARCDIPFMT